MVFLGPERLHQGGRGVHVPSSVFRMPMQLAPAAAEQSFVTPQWVVCDQRMLCHLAGVEVLTTAASEPVQGTLQRISIICKRS